MFVWYPLAKYSASAELEPGSSMEALVALVVTLIVLFPVVNKGFPEIFGSGICNENIKSPFSSLYSATDSTVASALPSALTKDIPFLTHPMLSILFSEAKSAVSIFNTWLVLEYAVGSSNTPMFGNMHLWIVSVGLLKTPNLWFGDATLNLMLADPVISEFELWTISLTEKVPLFIVIGRYFGTAYGVKSVFSMNT